MILRLKDVGKIFKGYEYKFKAKTLESPFNYRNKIPVINKHDLLECQQTHSLSINPNFYIERRKYKKEINYINCGDFVFDVASSSINFQPVITNFSSDVTYSNTMLVLRIKDKKLQKYLQMLFENNYFDEQLANLASQTSQGNYKLTKMSLGKLQFNYPDDNTNLVNTTKLNIYLDNYEMIDSEIERLKKLKNEQYKKIIKLGDV